jgi:acetyl-CoA acetyltransferase
MLDRPERRSIISGIGISPIGRRTGRRAIDLTVASATEAIADAGLTPADIDGISTMGDTPLAEAAAVLGIEPRYTGGGFDTGGLLSPLMSACVAVGEGRARHVLVYRTVMMVGGSIVPAANDTGNGAANDSPPAPAPAPDPRAARAALDAMGDMAPLLTAHAYSAANWLAMHCRRHMHLYGTTKEQLGWLAINSRRNAARNPLAVYREPMTMDDYLSARVVSTPFGLYDCDVPIDGSVAYVVSASEYAGDCPRHPVRVEAIGGAPGRGGWVDRPDYPKMASVEAAAEMWDRTDLRPSDVDIAQLYDGFTFLTFAWLEALGLCGDGEAGPFVEGATRIALDGDLPLNTYGGQLSAGRMHGYWVLHEACAQLRGDAGERQVVRRGGPPEVAVVSNGGGPIAGCMLVTR